MINDETTRNQCNYCRVNLCIIKHIKNEEKSLLQAWHFGMHTSLFISITRIKVTYVNFDRYYIEDVPSVT